VRVLLFAWTTGRLLSLQIPVLYFYVLLGVFESEREGRKYVLLRYSTCTSPGHVRTRVYKAVMYNYFKEHKTGTCEHFSKSQQYFVKLSNIFFWIDEHNF
jgi:hypothetical protein